MLHFRVAVGASDVASSSRYRHYAHHKSDVTNFDKKEKEMNEPRGPAKRTKQIKETCALRSAPLDTDTRMEGAPLSRAVIGPE